MSYIYSDLKRSARLTLGWMYSSPVYPKILTHPDQWYIDERASPKDFWALMSIAHPDICSRKKKLNKSSMKRAIDLIFEHSDQIKLFERMVKDGTTIVPSFLTREDEWEELECKYKAVDDENDKNDENE